jgi:hypothetical protein
MNHPTLWTVVVVTDGAQTVVTRCSSGILANMQKSSAQKVMARMGETGIVSILPPADINTRRIVEQTA